MRCLLVTLLVCFQAIGLFNELSPGLRLRVWPEAWQPPDNGIVCCENNFPLRAYVEVFPSCMDDNMWFDTRINTEDNTGGDYVIISYDPTHRCGVMLKCDLRFTNGADGVCFANRIEQ